MEPSIIVNILMCVQKYFLLVDKKKQSGPIHFQHFKLIFYEIDKLIRGSRGGLSMLLAPEKKEVYFFLIISLYAFHCPHSSDYDMNIKSLCDIESCTRQPWQACFIAFY